ncbi:MAG: hypothetical protein JXA13_04165 [Anaerolineales bacterium]|nr:hypothetical protein [Anaerolineales bacterium]
MNTMTKRTLWWLPRILGILFIIFLSLFAFDVFGEGYGFWETLLALIIHLTPSIVLIIVLLLAWRWEWIGTLAFVGAGFLYLVMAKSQHWSAYLLIGGIPMLIGVLFLTGWFAKKKSDQSGTP